MRRIILFLKKYKYWTPFVLLLIVYIFSLPKDLFLGDYSVVVYSREGKLLGAKIAKDHQWRFPVMDKVPEKFEKAILLTEDEYFYYHWGVNPVSVGKAFYSNIKAGKVVRGGSTITQQLIRLSRGKKRRTYGEKLVELLLATRVEFSYSKDEILRLYCSNAPFGGNIVGLDMAAWRYFGVSSENLSWAEAALLAVLPNAPGLIFPGKNQEILKQKRDRVLLKLYKKGYIEKEAYELALMEEMPMRTYDMPEVATHLTDRIGLNKTDSKVYTTINYELQKRVNGLVNSYYSTYKQFEVYNMAVMVTDVRSGDVLAYVGNTQTDKEHKKDVNIIHSARSTGSLLKPFLYCAMVESGEILPKQLVADIPIYVAGYSPENYENTYDGAVGVNEALYRSLNVPFVILLQKYGIAKFCDLLKKLELKDINKHPDHYGLSLILGGAESSMWDINRAYVSMAQRLNSYNKEEGVENTKVSYFKDKKLRVGDNKKIKEVFKQGAIWQTFEAMLEVNRPSSDVGWQYYNSSQKIAWKTGTSFGNRDAWSVGITPDYVVSVWVGNATGEGRPGLTGASVAGPVMFNIFSVLDKKSWFSEPYEDLEGAEICAVSGFLAGENCPKTKGKVIYGTKKGEVCPYHKLVHLTKDGNYQVNTSCEDLANIVTESRFVLPNVMEWFYRQKHLEYKPLPPVRTDCENSYKNISFIYPNYGSVIYQTKGMSGKVEPFLAKVACDDNVKVFWYIDQTYLGMTEKFHNMPILTVEGEHYLRVVDENGNEKSIKIIIK